MKKTSAKRDVKLWTECPYCKEYFDIMDYRYLDNRTNLIDDGYIYTYVEDYESWNEKLKDGLIIDCPECKKDFEVNYIEY